MFPKPFQTQFFQEAQTADHTGQHVDVHRGGWKSTVPGIIGDQFIRRRIMRHDDAARLRREQPFMRAEDVRGAFVNSRWVLIISGSMRTVENDFQGGRAAELVQTIYDLLYRNDNAGGIIYLTQHQCCPWRPFEGFGNLSDKKVFLLLPTSKIILRRKLQLTQLRSGDGDEPLCYFDYRRMLKGRDDYLLRPPGARQSNLDGAAGAAHKLNLVILPNIRFQQQFPDHCASFFCQLQQKRSCFCASGNIVLIKIYKFVGGLPYPPDLRRY